MLLETDFNEKWHVVPGGTDTGNFIHAILEWHADGHEEITGRLSIL